MKNDSSLANLLYDITVHSFSEIDSTNNEAKRQIALGNDNPSLYIAESQTMGRGRTGKSFYSPKGEGIYMSLALPVSSVSDCLKITPAAAVAVCLSIEKFTCTKPKIKWVNDIYLEGKKLCGILTESIVYNTCSFVIIGIGINISNSSFPKELKEIATSLNAENLPKDEFIAFIINTLTAYIYSLPHSSYMNEYRKRSLVLDKDIKFIKNGTAYCAHANFIDDDGHLHVTLSSGKKAVLSSGEITLRLN